MTSQSTIDEGLFGNLDVSLSLKAEDTEREKLRRRHKSSSDVGLRRAATLQEYDTKLRHQSSDMDHLQLANALSAQVSEEMEKTKGGSEKGSRLSGASMKPGHSTIIESGQEGDKPEENNGDADAFVKPLMNLDLVDNGGSSSEQSAAPSSHLLDMSPRRLSSQGVAKEAEDIFSDINDLKAPLARTNSSGSNTSSPSRSVRTPVTENDPLGLFHSPAKSAAAPSSVSGVPDLLGLNDTKASLSPGTKRNNLLIDVEPFRSPSNGSPSKDASGAGDANSTRTYTLLNTSPGASSHTTTSSPGSPPAAWAPLSQSQTLPAAAAGGRGDGPPAPGPGDELHKSSTSPASLDHLEKGVATPGTPSSKRGRMIARGESFRNALSSTAKSTASFFSSKFTSKLVEFKQTMSTTSDGSIERLDSEGGDLPKAHEMDKNLMDEDGKALKKAGSEEILDAKENFRNQSDSRSLDDTLDGTPSKSRPPAPASTKYAGYGE